jgi:hypothetical protein
VKISLSPYALGLESYLNFKPEGVI